MTADDLVCDSPADGVLQLTLNRPSVHNAITHDMAHRIDAELTRAAADDAVKVVVLAGAGDKAFSAGYDLAELAALSDDELAATAADHDELLWRYFTFPKPTIAAISGLAYGAGTLYAACSDLRVGGATTVLSVTAAKFGGANLTWILDHLVGAGMARDMLMTSRPVGGPEALSTGLITRYAGDDDVDAVALGVAGELTAKPLEALVEIKQLVSSGPGRSLHDRFTRENQVGQTTLRQRRLASKVTRFTAGTEGSQR